MSTVFDMLKLALAPFVGGPDAAGMILGLSVIVIWFTGFLLMFGRDLFNKPTTGLVMLLIPVAFVSAPGVNWFPIWVPFLIVLALAFMYWQKYL